MHRIVVLALLVPLLAGCHLAGYGHRASRPALAVHGAAFDRAILNRDPPRYGIGEPAGDVVLREMRIDISELATTDAGILRIGGAVYDAESGTVVVPRFRLETDDGRETPLAAMGEGGRFSLEADPAAAVMTVSALGHRTLRLDLRRLAALARSALESSPTHARPSSGVTSSRIQRRPRRGRARGDRRR
jgi:hypothetical protein